MIDNCQCKAKERKYYLRYEPLCDMHYLGYLELLLDSLNIEVSNEKATSSFVRSIKLS